MQVFRTVPARAAFPTVLAIGNFDGLHLGHRALLERLTEKARQLNLPAAVLTFEPHPREVFAPEDAPARLTCLREKLKLFAEQGIDHVYVLRFSRKLAALGADDFISTILAQGLAVRYLLIGDDFRFGRGRSGDFALLQKAGGEQGFTVDAMPTIDMNGERVSSSAVRAALAAGDIEHAARLLGRPYGIAGRVVHGNKLGSRIGYPTANIQLKRKRVPLAGVFTAMVNGLGNEPVCGAASLGVRPTLGEGLKPVLEVHLLDFDRAIYGEHVTVHFLHKLRDEAKFASLDALAAQIARDVAATRAYFSGESHG